MTKGQVEAQIKESFTKLFRKNMGKGPANIIVKITRNFIIVEIKGILTPLEKKLVK